MIKILSRYNHGQLNIRLPPRKEYRILTKQDTNETVVQKCS